MADVEFTSSVSSGYATDVSYFSMGNRKAMMAHYSAPTGDRAYIETGMFAVEYIHVNDADPTTYVFSANAVGMQAAYFSGLVTGSTGTIFLLGY
jgi:hypothetical protein